MKYDYMVIYTPWSSLDGEQRTIVMQGDSIQHAVNRFNTKHGHLISSVDAVTRVNSNGHASALRRVEYGVVK